jgi:hypothetical protein
MTQPRTPYLVTFLIFVATALWLAWSGRVLICQCGYIKFWHGDNFSAESSQHLFDWYSPSHLIHGLLFYAVLWLVARRVPVGWRLAIATAVECLWEVVENSDAIIERYRSVTISLDYFGDSVINSVADVVAMWVGFALARVVPVWAAVAIVVGFEVLTMIVIRDGLALNILMLLSPLDAVRTWQAGG